MFHFDQQSTASSFIFILIEFLFMVARSDSSSPIDLWQNSQYNNAHHSIQHDFLERGCHDRLVGILIGRSGYITSRRFVPPALHSADGTHSNYTYPANEYCQWMIKAAPDFRIRLRFTHFDVEAGKGCAYDNVTIWQISPHAALQVLDSRNSAPSNRNMSSNPLRSMIGVFCGSETPPMVESAAATSLLVVFQTDSSVGRSGFRLVWEAFSVNDPLEQACNMKDGEHVTLNGAQGIIQLNHFDKKTPYSSNLQCAWKIHIPAGKLVRLFFEHLDVEKSKDCAFDYLEVYDGGVAVESKRLGKYCGTYDQPFTLTSSWNEMLVIFKSDNSTEATGFQLKWQEITLVGAIEMGCWQTRPALIKGRTTGVLHLPGYNGISSYEPNMDCKWYISVEPNQTIKIKITHLSVEPEAKGCLHDRLVFLHPSKLIEPMAFCGANAPQEIIHWKSSEVLIEFKSDDSIQASGFRLEWAESTAAEQFLQTFPAPTTATTTTTSKTSTLTTTTETTTVKSTTVMAATTTTTQIYEQTVRDMAFAMRRHPIPEIVQHESHGPLASRSVPMAQHAPPADSEERQTPPTSQFFSCQTPRRYYYSRAGKLSSPGFGLAEYPATAHCSYIVTVPDGHFVRLNFTTFETEYSSNCENDYVAIYDGGSELNKTIAKLCGYQNPGKTIDSISNRILVVFHSNEKVAYKGFEATFAAIHVPNHADAGCWWGEENPAVISADSGILTSRNFDGVRPYFYNQNCAWRLTANSTSRIKIQFTHFSLESSGTGCAGDTLSIYDGADKAAAVLGVFCGIAVPPPILSSGNNLFITFKTDEKIEKTGFRLEWHSLPAMQLPSQSNTSLDMAEEPFNSFNTSGDDIRLVPNSIIQASWPGSDGKISKGTSQNVVHTNNYPNFNQANLAILGNQNVAQPMHLPHNLPPGVRRISSASDHPTFRKKPMVEMLISPRQQAIYRSARPQGSASQQSKEQLPNIRDLPFGHRTGSNAPIFEPPFNIKPGQSSGEKYTFKDKSNEAPQISSNYGGFDAIFSTHSPEKEDFEVTTTEKPSVTTKEIIFDDECLEANHAMEDDKDASSFFGSCSDGAVKVLTSKKAVNPGGVITSGHFDRRGMYPMLQNCIWSIRVPPGFRISLKLLHFDLERGRDETCPYDRLEIWDGTSIPEEESQEMEKSSVMNSTNELGEFCGSSPRKTSIVSSSSALTIRFVTDAVVQRTGFCIKWQALPIESELLIAEEFGGKRLESNSFLSGNDMSSEPSGCGGPKYMSRGSGHIKSPNYGTATYYPNLDCSWVISAPSGKIVRVNLIDVDIEPDVSCRYDFLALYDGASEYATPIKRFCGRARPTIVKSTSNTVYLQFRTDGTAGGKGFLIEYSFTDPPT